MLEVERNEREGEEIESMKNVSGSRKIVQAMLDPIMSHWK